MTSAITRSRLENLIAQAIARFGPCSASKLTEYLYPNDPELRIKLSKVSVTLKRMEKKGTVLRGEKSFKGVPYRLAEAAKPKETEHEGLAAHFEWLEKPLKEVFVEKEERAAVKRVPVGERVKRIETKETITKVTEVRVTDEPQLSLKGRVLEEVKHSGGLSAADIARRLWGEADKKKTSSISVCLGRLEREGHIEGQKHGRRRIFAIREFELVPETGALKMKPRLRELEGLEGAVFKQAKILQKASASDIAKEIYEGATRGHTNKVHVTLQRLQEKGLLFERGKKGRKTYYTVQKPLLELPEMPRVPQFPKWRAAYTATVFSIAIMVIVAFNFMGTGFLAAPHYVLALTLDQQQADGLQNFVYGVSNINSHPVGNLIIEAILPQNSSLMDYGGAQISQRGGSTVLTWLISQIQPNEKQAFSFSGRVPGQIRLYATGLSAQEQAQDILDHPVQAILPPGEYGYKKIGVPPVGYLGEIAIDMSAGPEGTEFTNETVTVPEIPIVNVTQNITTVVVSETPAQPEQPEQNATPPTPPEQPEQNVTPPQPEEPTTPPAQPEQPMQNETPAQPIQNVTPQQPTQNETPPTTQTPSAEPSQPSVPTGGIVQPPEELIVQPKTTIKIYLDSDESFNGNEDLIGEAGLGGTWDGTLKLAVPSKKYTDGMNLVFYSDKGAVVLLKSLNLKWVVEVPVNASETYLAELYENLTANATEIDAEISVTDALGAPVDASVTLEDRSGAVTAEKTPLKKERHSFKAKNVRQTLKITPTQNHVKEIMLDNAKLAKNMAIRLDDVPETVATPANVKAWSEVYALDTGATDFVAGTLKAIAKGNALFKCKEWNFTARTCNGEWAKIMELTPGAEYSVPLSQGDPAYGEANITIINVQSFPTVGGNWTVMFNTTGTADLTIKAVDGTTWSNSNENNQLKFIEVRCGNSAVNYQWVDNSVFISNYSCAETGTEVSKVIMPGVHNLEFRFGDDVKQAHNQANGWFVQTGEKTMNARTVPIDLTTVVNTSATFILLSVRASSTYDDPDMSGIRAEWVNSTRFNLIQFSGTVGAVVVWQAVENPNIYVQNGTKAYFSSERSFNIPISSINVSRTVVFMTVGSCNASGAVASYNTVHWTGNVTNSTNLNITRDTTGTCGGNVSYFVAEFNDGSVIQRGQISGVGATTTPSYAVVSAINMTNTWFYFSMAHDSTSNALSEVGLRARHFNTTAFAVSKTIAGGTARIQWYAITTPGSYVQNGTLNLNSGGGSNTAINAITSNRSIVVHSSNDAGTGTTFSNLLTTAWLTTTTNLNISRLGTANAHNVSWQVVEFPAFTPTTISWNESEYYMGAKFQKAGNLTGAADITSSNINTGVNVTCDSGNCTNITDDWVDGTNLTDGQTATVNFTCWNTTSGRKWALFNVTSDGDTTADQINVSCFITIQPRVTWLTPTLDIGEVANGENATANASLDTASDNLNVTIYGTGGNGTSFISAIPPYIANITGGASENIMFNCSPVGKAAGYYEGIFHANSSNDTDGSDITVSCSVAHSPPTQDNPILNSTFGTNLTTENLTCYNQSTADYDGDPVKNIFDWSLNGTTAYLTIAPFEGGSTNTSTREYSGALGYNLTAAATWNGTAGYDGKGAYQFDGATQYIDLDSGGASPIYDAAFTERTVGVWFKAGNISETVYRMLYGEGGTTNGMELFVYDGRVYGGAWSTAHWAGSWQSFATTAGEWHFVAVAFNGATNTTSVFYDGQWNTTTTDGADLVAAHTGDDGIGWADASKLGPFGTITSGAYFSGTIDDYFAINRSLSQEQLDAIYRNRTDMLLSQELAVGNVWTCEVTPNDGYRDGPTLPSNDVAIIAAAPGGLFYTVNGSNTTAPPAFTAVALYANWSNSSALGYAILSTNETGAWKNQTAVAFSGADGWSNFTWQNLSTDGDTVVAWRIYANDTSGSQNVTEINTFTLGSSVSITLTQTAVGFGSMASGASNSTSGDVALPFKIRNDGNVKVNITINGTDLFTESFNPTTSYRYAANESSEGVNYNTLCSDITLTNVPAFNAPRLFMCFLNWLDSTDEAETEIAINIPNSEPSGAKTSTVTFIASQA